MSRTMYFDEGGTLKVEESRTLIPTMTMRWLIDYDGHRELQQLHHTTSGELRWITVPERRRDEDE